MIESDHSETEEGDMDRLQLSSDSIDIVSPKKRLRVEDSEDEADLPAKKRQSFSSEQSKMLKKDNAETISDKNGTDACNVKEGKDELYLESEQNVQEKSPSVSNIDRENEEERHGEWMKQENGNKNPLDESNTDMDKCSEEMNIKKEMVENEDSPPQKLATNTNVMSASEDKKVGNEDNEIVEAENDKMMDKKQHNTKRHTVDTEVVDGLELSVECASDKEEPSSESEGEKDAKPRPKTIIVKAEPNESELDCSSSEGEKSDLQQVADTLEIKSGKSRMRGRGSRTSFSKLKASGSEDSQNNNSDEDYSPRTKKKMKKSLMTRKSTNKYRSVESKRGRGRGLRRNSDKKSAVHISEDEAATVAEKVNKTTRTNKNGLEEELSEKESLSKSESDNNSEKEEKSMKGRRGRHTNAKPENKHIQMLKKYLSIAGVKVRSYNDIWADCKSNAAKIKRLKELLEKNGISGRPTLEKCKRVREENEKMREVSELDASNIISEGRVTRARRNMENVKKTTTAPGTPPRHREARNTFKRIQTVVDSDSE